MVTSLLKSVTKQLGTTFGDKNKYYIEDVEQGLLKDCFLINTSTPIQRSKSRVLYDRTIPVVVHYFRGDKNDIKKKLYEMGDLIVECLEYLQFNGTLLRGEDISYQILEDDVLQVFITYRFTTMRVIKDGGAMLNIDTGTSTK